MMEIVDSGDAEFRQPLSPRRRARRTNVVSLVCFGCDQQGPTEGKGLQQGEGKPLPSRRVDHDRAALKKHLLLNVITQSHDVDLMCHAKIMHQALESLAIAPKVRPRNPRASTSFVGRWSSPQWRSPRP